MKSKASTGIPGLLDQLLSPTTPIGLARNESQASSENRPAAASPENNKQEARPTPPHARIGRPPGIRPVSTHVREKVTLRLPTDLTAAYRDWSWEARTQLSHLVELALADYRASHRK